MNNFISKDDPRLKNHIWEQKTYDLVTKYPHPGYDLLSYKNTDNHNVLTCLKCNIIIKQVYYNFAQTSYTFINCNGYYIEVTIDDLFNNRLLTCEEQIIKNIIE